LSWPPFALQLIIISFACLPRRFISYFDERRADVASEAAKQSRHMIARGAAQLGRFTLSPSHLLFSVAHVEGYDNFDAGINATCIKYAARPLQMPHGSLKSSLTISTLIFTLSFCIMNEFISG